jgi:hypothetical protein
MSDLSNVGKIGRVRMWREESGGGERDVTFSSFFTRQHQNPFLISASNFSRNRIEQLREFRIFSKE